MQLEIQASVYPPAPQPLIQSNENEIYYKMTIEDEYGYHSSVKKKQLCVIKYFNDCICNIDACIGVNWDYNSVLNIVFDKRIL